MTVFKQFVKQVVTQRKSDEIVSQIKSMIFKGILKVGDTMPTEQELCEAFGVSRTSLREAIWTLINMNLIDNTHGKKKYILSITDDLVKSTLSHFIEDNHGNFVQYFEVRLGIESFIISLAAFRRTQKDLQSIYSAWEKFRDHMIKYHVAVEPDIQFHLSIAQSSQNTILFHLMTTFMRAQKQILSATTQLYSDEEIKTSVENHLNIYKGIEEKNPRRAIEALRSVLNFAINTWEKKEGLKLNPLPPFLFSYQD